MGNRGGKREGAGRKPLMGESRIVTMSFVCTERQSKMIDETAEALKISKSEYIRSRLFG